MELNATLLASAMEHQAHYHAFLGALIGGAISLFGGLSARKDAKKRDAAAAEAAKVPVETEQRVSHRVDLPALVAQSQAAGFNPMTILNAGGLSAFTETEQWTSTTGQNAMAAVPTAPSFGTVLAGAASTAFNIAREDMQAAKTAALSSFPPAPRMDMATALGWSAGGGVAGGGGAQFRASPSLHADGRPIKGSIETPTVTNPHTSAYVDPSLPDAEMSETRYGDSEILSMLTGGYTIYSDLVYNLTGSTNAGRNAVYGKAYDAVKGAYNNAASYLRGVSGGVLSQTKKPKVRFGRHSGG